MSERLRPSKHTSETGVWACRLLRRTKNRHVPHLADAVFADGDELPAIGTEGQRADAAAMSLESGGGGGLAHVPDPDRAGAAAGGQVAAVGGEGHGLHVFRPCQDAE